MTYMGRSKTAQNHFRLSVWAAGFLHAAGFGGGSCLQFFYTAYVRWAAPDVYKRQFISSTILRICAFPSPFSSFVCSICILVVIAPFRPRRLDRSYNYFLCKGHISSQFSPQMGKTVLPFSVRMIYYPCLLCTSRCV